jgi:hypothetical protein
VTACTERRRALSPSALSPLRGFVGGFATVSRGLTPTATLCRRCAAFGMQPSIAWSGKLMKQFSIRCLLMLTAAVGALLALWKAPAVLATRSVGSCAHDVRAGRLWNHLLGKERLRAGVLARNGRLDDGDRADFLQPRTFCAAWYFSVLKSFCHPFLGPISSQRAVYLARDGSKRR